MSRTVTGTGDVATAVGQVMTLTFTPKLGGALQRILATGDTDATILTAMSGERPLVVDPLPCSLLAASAFHGPDFDGACLQAGVPVTVTYTAGSTTSPLRLTFTVE